jgi:hypothetical protein
VSASHVAAPGTWLADLCAQEGIPFILGHVLYVRAIHGSKAKRDTIDVHPMAVWRRGGSLPRPLPRVLGAMTCFASPTASSGVITRRSAALGLSGRLRRERPRHQDTPRDDGHWIPAVGMYGRRPSHRPPGNAPHPCRLPPVARQQVTRISWGALPSSHFGMNGLRKTRGLFWRIVKVQIRFIHLQLDQTEGTGARDHAIDARVERHHR